jgi:hypothetical protein
MMNWKGCGRKRWWPCVKVPFRHLPGGAEEGNERTVRLADLQAEI